MDQTPRRCPPATPAMPGLRGMDLMTDLIAIPQKHYSDVLAAAWRAHDGRLAERFRQAMKKARSELGQGGNFTAILKRAWASDPDLRGQFGDAVSAGLRKMWSDAAVRAEQSERIRRTYTQDLRKQRSETLREKWADADFRKQMLRARVRLSDGRFGARGRV
jgi:hypothetical protein